MLRRFATLPDTGNPDLENRQNAIRTCLLLFLRRVLVCKVCTENSATCTTGDVPELPRLFFSLLWHWSAKRPA